MNETEHKRVVELVVALWKMVWAGAMTVTMAGAIVWALNTLRGLPDQWPLWRPVLAVVVLLIAGKSYIAAIMGRKEPP